MSKTFGRQTIPALAFAVAIALGAAVAVARERFPPPPAGEGWRTLAGDGSVVTSQCIGELSSPTCIVDTLIACDAWTPYRYWAYDYVDESWLGGYHPICDVLRTRPGHGDSNPRTLHIGTAIGGPKYVLYYYKVVPFRVTEENLPDWAVGKGSGIRFLDWQAGDVAVAVAVVRCVAPPRCQVSEATDEQPARYRDDCPLDACRRLTIELAAITRRVRDGWAVVDTFQPYRDATWPYLEEVYRRMR